ncbi:MAG TPA: ThuA domain-containing protein [Fimbriiglobus sp.]|nr:ThuA domain-containing protein [Fimbriiglobus sp.]
MRPIRLLLAALPALVLAAAPSSAGDAAPAPAAAQKRLLLVTHSGGFIHDSVGVAEDVLKEIGPKHGFTVTCYRLTNPADPAIVKKKTKGGAQGLEAYAQEFRARTGKVIDQEHTGKIDKETLKNFDVVLFFTTGNPMTEEQTRDLVAWVKAGGSFAGTHCATDTLYGDAAYGNLIGAYFRGHPQIQQIKVHVEDPKHPAAAGFTDGMPYTDEMYVFRNAPYSRDKLHVILSIEKGSFDMGKNLVRTDGDYAISWTRLVGKGRVFYTSLGHRKEVWKDERYQKHLFGGLNWALGEN